MERNRPLQLISRKGTALEKLDLYEEERKGQIRLFIDRGVENFFAKPVQSLGLLILFFAVPLSLFIAFRDEFSSQNVSGMKGQIVQYSVPAQITPNRDYSQTIRVTSAGVSSIQHIGIKTPEWLQLISSDESQSDELVSLTLDYTGLPPLDTQSSFIQLFRSHKNEVEDCFGCNDNDEYFHALIGFTLATQDCDERTSVWARNPVGPADSSNPSTVCQKYPTSCTVPAGWKQYPSQDACLSQDPLPYFTSDFEDVTVTLQTDCDTGEIESENLSFDFSAIDDGGDIVRFSVDSFRDIFEVNQDSVEAIVRDVYSNNLSFPAYRYEGQIVGTIDQNTAGMTIPISVNACNMTGDCREETFQLQVVSEDVCEFPLPETGESVNVFVDTTDSVEDVSSTVPLLVYLSGAAHYDLEFQLLTDNCNEFAKTIKRVERYTVNGNKGYVYDWNSNSVENGEYTIRALARDSDSGGAWADYHDIQITVLNNNSPPQITTTPEHISLVTGETYQYTPGIQSASETLSYRLVNAPGWLSVSRDGVVSGSTVVPGGYVYVLEVRDEWGQSIRQLLYLNVFPPENDRADISFDTSLEGILLSGEGNEVEWSVYDADGVEAITLEYTHDMVQWNLLGTFPATKNAFSWDVGSLPTGQYIFKLTVVDSSDQSMKAIELSEPFYIVHPGTESSPEARSLPAISNVSPVEDAEVITKRPLISADIHYAREGQDSVVTVFIDEVPAETCEFEGVKLMCELEDDLQLGRHKVRIDVDSHDDGISNTRVWFFDVVESISGNDESFADSDSNTIQLPVTGSSRTGGFVVVALIVVVVALAMILLLGVIMSIRRSGRRRPLPRLQASPMESTPATEQEISSPPPFVY